MDAQHHVMLEVAGHLAHLHIDLVAHGAHGLDHASAGTRDALLSQSTFQRLLHAFAGDGHQSKVIELEHLGWGPVRLKRVFQRLHDLLAVLAFIHINEVDHDDAAEVAQAYLAHDFLDGVDVGLHDSVFEAGRLTDVFAGVDVDGDQRLRLVDYDVTAALQPYLGLQRLVDLVRDVELLEQRSVFGVELYALHQRGLEAAYEAHDALVLDRKSTRLNSSHANISYAVFCLKKKNN